MLYGVEALRSDLMPCKHSLYTNALQAARNAQHFETSSCLLQALKHVPMYMSTNNLVAFDSRNSNRREMDLEECTPQPSQGKKRDGVSPLSKAEFSW